MKAAENKVVVIHYTLVSDSGELLDTSSGGEPLAYIHGAGNLVPGDANETWDIFRLDRETGDLTLISLANP